MTIIAYKKLQYMLIILVLLDMPQTLSDKSWITYKKPYSEVNMTRSVYGDSMNSHKIRLITVCCTHWKQTA